MTLVQLQADLFIPADFETNHYYFADAEGKKEYTGITTILRVMAKPALIQWAANEAVKYIKENLSYKRMKLFRKGYVVVKSSILDEASKAHTKKKEAAGEHGTDMHALCEKWILQSIKINSGTPLAGSVPTNIKKFGDWAIDNVKTFLAAERPVHSKSLFLAGTIDFIAVMKDGRRVIGDLKTSSAIWYEAMLQVAAYRILAEEEGDENYDAGVIVRMGKDGKFQVAERVNNQSDRDAFLGLLSVYRGQATYVVPKNG